MDVTVKGSEVNAGRLRATEPRWPALIVSIAIAGIFWGLPERLTLGPAWLVPAIIMLLMISVVLSHRAGKANLNAGSGIALLIVTTVAEVWSLGVLITGIPHRRQDPLELSRAAVAIWVSNVLVFACWYWRLDAGGPHSRDLRPSHNEGAFLFPQMTLGPDSTENRTSWKPGFVDYLFLAFNTSVAFSPTDTPVLSRWAKLVMMVQSSVSLSTIAILAARAISLF
jgi:hypothetical protein